MGKLGTVIAAFALVAAGLSTPSTAAPQSMSPAQTQQIATTASPIRGAATARISGANAYAIAVNISRHRYADPTKARVVYLARSDTLTDALVGGTLADGPVLLVRPYCGSLPTVTAGEVARINPAKVIALGDTTSVCDQVLSQAAAGRATARVTGANRYESSANIARRAFPNGSATVYLTKGSITADAAAAGALRDGPILLVSTDGSTVPTATTKVLAELNPSKVIALGGTTSVSQAALASAGAGRTTGRVGGADRYEVAYNIARRAYPTRTSRVYVARGDGDNFRGAVLAGALTDGPVLLTPGTCEPVNSKTKAFLRARHPSGVLAIGGTSSLCSSTLVGASMASRVKPDCSVLKCVAITYDDGPGAGTPTLLNTLASKRVPATFFVVGQMVDANPAPTRRAYVEGHTIANHTWDHKQLTTLTKAQQQWEVDVTDNELAQHRIKATTLLRPPYGSYDTNTRNLGFPLILWDVDPRDWEGPPSSATTRQRVVSAARNGSIILMHDIHWNTVNAAPGIIDDLHSLGFTLVTVNELIPGLQPGQLVYRRGSVTSLSVEADPSDVIITQDGRELGPVLDESGVPGLAPDRSLQEILEGAGSGG